LNKLMAITSYLGMAAVVALTLLTGLDVGGRYIFNLPLPGTFELTEVILSVIVAFGVVITTASDEHILVDALFVKLSSSAQRVLLVVAGVVGALVLGIMSWKGLEAALEAMQTHEATMLLNVPISPFKLVLFLGFFLSLIFLFIRIVHLLVKKHG
jgi:TRAP-type transport system small permease protein